MEQKLIDYFKQKHQPLAIILHGSRAVGKEKEHSDWDTFFVLKEPRKIYREIVFGQNCEGANIGYPISDVDLKKHAWSLRRGNARVLFEVDGIGTEILERCAKITESELPMSKEEWQSWQAWYAARIDSMKDYRDDPVAVTIKIGHIYQTSVVLWFEKHKGHSAPSVYFIQS
jgi:hypothetical protein